MAADLIWQEVSHNGHNKNAKIWHKVLTLVAEIMIPFWVLVREISLVLALSQALNLARHEESKVWWAWKALKTVRLELGLVHNLFHRVKLPYWPFSD